MQQEIIVNSRNYQIIRNMWHVWDNLIIIARKILLWIYFIFQKMPTFAII